MKKLTLSSSGSRGSRRFYVFKKSENFPELFRLFLIELGFSNLGIYSEENIGMLPNFMNWKDHLEHFEDDDYDMDLLVTKEKVFLIIRMKKENIDRKISLAAEKISNF